MLLKSIKTKIMKKLSVFLFFIFCTTLIFACKNDEDKEPTTREKLTNKTWVVTDSKTEIAPLPDSLTNGLDLLEGIRGQEVVFREDGTFTVGETDTQQQGTWTLSDDEKKIVFTGLVEGDLAEFVNAQTLTNLQTFEVTTLTDSKLILQNSTSVDVSAEIAEQLIGVAFPFTVTVKLNITFDKQ